MDSQQWQPTPSIWQAQGTEFYAKMKKGAAAAGLAEQVLHISESDRRSMTSTIETLLKDAGVGETDILGSNSQQENVTAIVKALMKNERFSVMLHWAQNEGESISHVEDAIKLCVHSVHNARRKRAKRQTTKRGIRSPTRLTDISQLKIQTKSASTATVDAAPAREQVPTENTAIYIKLTSDERTYDLLSLRDILNPQGKPSFKMLREQVQRMLDFRKPSSEVESFRWMSETDPVRISNDFTLSYSLQNSNNQPRLVANLSRKMILPTRSRSISTFRDFIPINSDVHDSIEEIDGRYQRNLSSIHSESSSSESEGLAAGTRKRRKKASQNGDEHTQARPRGSPLKKTRKLAILPTDTITGQELSCSLTDSRSATGQREEQPSHSSSLSKEIEDEDDNDSEQAPHTQPAIAPVLHPSYKLPPPDLPSWDVAEADCENIGTIELDQGHDDNDLYQEPQDQTNAEADDEGEVEVEAEDDRILLEILANEKKLRRVKEHLDRGLLNLMHALFKTDSETQSGHDALIPLQSLRRPLMIHQAYGAFYILWAEMVGTTTTTRPGSEVPGSKVPGVGYHYLADEVGYGKSATAATIIVLCRWLEYAWEEVTKSRHNQDGLHLQASELDGYQQDPKVRCPSSEPFGVCCPCVEANPASKLRPVQGIVTFIVPTNLLINSVQEWYQQVDMDTNFLGFHLHVQTTRPAKSKANIARLMRNGSEHKVDLQTMLAGQTVLNRLRTKIHEDRPLPAGLLGHIFFCSPDSYNNYMEKREFHNLPCGRILRDEFHQQPAMNNNIMKKSREIIINRWNYKPSASPSITLMSGTPVRMGPQDLYGAMSLGTLSLLRKSKLVDNTTRLDHFKHWEDLSEAIHDPFWKACTPWGLSSIKADWNSHDHAKSSAAKERWSIFTVTSMIARGRGSRWIDNNVLMPMPRMRYRVVTTSLSLYRQKQIRRALNQEGKTMTGSELSVKLQKCGTFPGLATLTKDTNYKLGKDWMDANKLFSTNYKRNVFRSNIKKLVNTSPKMNALQSILDTMLVRKDFSERPAKGIIFTDSNEAALIIQLWIEETYAPNRTHPVKSALIYGGIDKASRQRLTAEFQDGEEYNLIIGVASSLGTGVTLTRAMFTVIMEQIGDPGQWTQLIGRMHRKGNYNWKGVLVFELLLSDWTSDQIIRERRKGRRVWADQQEQQMEKEFAEGANDKDEGEPEDDESDGQEMVGV